MSLITMAGRWRAGGVLGGALLAVLMLGACQSGRPGHLAPDPADSVESESGLIAFYRGPLNHLHAVRFGSCPMHPTCSEYARRAVAAYGPVQGWVMAMDRLLRCGRDEIGLAPIIYINGKPRSYDPLPANALGPTRH